MYMHSCKSNPAGARSILPGLWVLQNGSYKKVVELKTDINEFVVYILARICDLYEVPIETDCSGFDP